MMNVLAATIPVENRIVIPANKSETSWWSNCFLFFFKALLSSKIFSEGITPQPLHIWHTDIYIKLTINRWRKFHVSKQNPKITHAHFHVKVMYWSACETLVKFGAYSGNALARVQRVHELTDLWDITFCTR